MNTSAFRLRHRNLLAVCGSLVLLQLVPPAVFAADCSSIILRVGTSRQDSQLTALGQEVILAVGATTNIYLQTESRIPDRPYSTQSSLGLPSDFGYEEYPRHDVLKLVDIEPQTAEDETIGRLGITVKEAGFGALGYQIRSVSDPANINDIPVDCRRGLISFHAVDEDSHLVHDSQDAGLGRFTAADTLVQRILSATSGQDEDRFYPKEYFDRVYEDGLGGMIVVLAEGLTRTRIRANQESANEMLPERTVAILLGNHERPFVVPGFATAARQCANASSALDCVDLAQLMISSERFKNHNADLLRSFAIDPETP